MAQILSQLMYIILSIFLFSLLIEGESKAFSTSLPPKSLHLKKEKLTHLHFYWHDIIGGDHPSKVKVAEAPSTNRSKTLFGAVSVLDDPLRLGPEENSTIVGRAQGIYAWSDQNEFSLVMALSFVFTEGKYNGSTLSLLARNPTLLPNREMPIVGGSGVFRYARGYAIANTSKFIPNLIAVVEFDFYVLHYGDSQK